jgi:hypothetical protein
MLCLFETTYHAYDAKLRLNKPRTRPEKERVFSSMSCTHTVSILFALMMMVGIATDGQLAQVAPTATIL